MAFHASPLSGITRSPASVLRLRTQGGRRRHHRRHVSDGLLDPVEPFELSLQTTFSSSLYSPMRGIREASQGGIRSLFVIASSSYSPCKMKQVVNSSKWRQDQGRQGHKHPLTNRRKHQMKNLKNFVEQLHREECGQDIIEYVLIAAFITAAVIATVTAVGKWVLKSWSNLNAQLT